jgi:hypothetical protein
MLARGTDREIIFAFPYGLQDAIVTATNRLLKNPACSKAWFAFPAKS